MTHCQYHAAHNRATNSTIPIWGTAMLMGIKNGPLKLSEIVYPSPWPSSRRIPGRTLPVSGRARGNRLTQRGPLGLLDAEPVPGLRQLPGCMSDRTESSGSEPTHEEKFDEGTEKTDKKTKIKGMDKAKKTIARRQGAKKRLQ